MIIRKIIVNELNKIGYTDLIFRHSKSTNSFYIKHPNLEIRISDHSNTDSKNKYNFILGDRVYKDCMKVKEQYYFSCNIEGVNKFIKLLPIIKKEEIVYEKIKYYYLCFKYSNNLFLKKDLYINNLLSNHISLLKKRLTKNKININFNEFDLLLTLLCVNPRKNKQYFTELEINNLYMNDYIKNNFIITPINT